MLPLTIVQFQALFGFGTRPFRADYLVFLWSAVPWWWSLRDPFAFLRPAAWAAVGRTQAARVDRWARAFRAEPRDSARRAGAQLRAWTRRYLGLDAPVPGRRGAAGAGARRVAEIGD